MEHQQEKDTPDYRIYELEIPDQLRIGQTIAGFTMWVKSEKKQDVFYLTDDEFDWFYPEWLDWLNKQ